jgi:hypothetical protein
MGSFFVSGLADALDHRVALKIGEFLRIPGSGTHRIFSPPPA